MVFQSRFISNPQLYKQRFCSAEWKQPGFTCVANRVAHLTQTKCACTLTWPTSVIWKVFPSARLHTGSLAKVLHAQEHHFSPDELSGVITVRRRPVTQIKAALPGFVSAPSCFCSLDPALMRICTPLPRRFIPFHLCETPFTFTQYYYGLISPSWDQACAACLCFWLEHFICLFNIQFRQLQLD